MGRSLGMWANTLVHVFMYYYYFQQALGNKVWFKVHTLPASACAEACLLHALMRRAKLGLGHGARPSSHQKYITTMQIVQFGVSFLLALPFLYYQSSGQCLGLEAFVFSMVCNGIFLFLFIRFYEREYAAKRQASKAAAGKDD